MHVNRLCLPPMTQTKTVSTRIDNNIHTLFTQYCNLKGLTMSQMLNQFVNDIVTQNKVFINSLQCSKKDESTKPQNFSQDEHLEEELKPRKTLDQKIRVLDSKNRKE
jgi:antitoxin component of RelBE/YafQ-DinJ toxin-antitoxin module